MKRFKAFINIPVLVALLVLQGCGPATLSKVHDNLNKAAKLELAAAKSNRSFYESGIYGPVGSEKAIDIRQKGAKAVHDSNEYLIKALVLAKALTPETFEKGKLAVLQELANAAAQLHTGNQTIDLVLAGIATVISQVVILIEAFQAADLPRALPTIRSWQLASVEA